MLQKLHDSYSLPLQSISIPVYDNSQRERYYVTSHSVLLSDDQSITARILPDRVSVSAHSMMVFFSMTDIINGVEVSEDKTCITFDNDDDLIIWLSLLLSEAWKESSYYKENISLLYCADYLGRGKMFNYSIMPISNGGPYQIGATTLIGQILFNGEYILPDRFTPVTQIIFPDAGKYWDSDTKKKVDQYDYMSLEDDVLFIELWDKTDSVTVNRMVSQAIFLHCDYDVKDFSSGNIGIPDFVDRVKLTITQGLRSFHPVSDFLSLKGKI